MIKLGEVYKAQQHPYHRWVVLNDPASKGNQVFIASITTLEENSLDDECILEQSDYPELSHKSVVAFSMNKYSGNSTGFEAAVKLGKFVKLADIPAPTLQRIVAAAKASEYLSAAEKRLL